LYSIVVRSACPDLGKPYPKSIFTEIEAPDPVDVLIVIEAFELYYVPGSTIAIEFTDPELLAFAVKVAVAVTFGLPPLIETVSDVT